VTFRLRVTLLVAAAVAVSAVAAAAVMYFTVEQQLISEVDATLVETADSATLVETANSPQILGPRRDRGYPFGRSGTLLLSGRPDIFAQIVDASGGVVSADGEPEPELVTSEVRSVASGQRRSAFSDVEVEGRHVRVYAVALGNGRALQLARPLDEIDNALGQTRLALVALALGGVLLAAILGALVARAALVPVRRLTATVEEVTRTRDLSRRVALSGRDEVSRLAASFDGMLRALEASLRSQRQLVADASHELRTPLTSLRTNLELLARGQPQDERERQQVLVDLVAQIERLSTLVADLIDLARDEEAPLPVEDLRLDEIAEDAVEGMRARYAQVQFRLEQRPTTIRGVRSRVARAVTNLLDNAAKWSPSGGVVEVAVADGEVTVRDHGPGIAPEDSGRVFDRFWRASTARHLPGSGLGLSIVKDVAETHGGAVTLEHPSDGGARFRLRLGGGDPGGGVVGTPGLIKVGLTRAVDE
jgi:two-component system sensor histidine kinase MprB